MVKIGAKIATNCGKRLPAYTLFETVVAITIITVLIGLGSLIYSAILDAENPVIYYHVEEQINEHFIGLQESKAYFNQNFDHESYSIQQDIKPYNGNTKLVEVTYTAFLGAEELLIRKHLVVNPQNEN